MKPNIPRIMLIPPQILPIPSIGGGGIETVVTNLIDVNEKEKRVFFVIPSQYLKGVESFHYHYSKIYYFDKCKPTNNPFCFSRFKFSFIWVLALFKKILFNRFTFYLFRKKGFVFPNYFLYQCLLIAKKEKVDYIVNESCLIDSRCFDLLSKYLGKNKIYFRVHNSTPVGTKEERLAINNSISLSEYGKQKWISGCDISGDNEVVYSGINLNIFNVDNLDKIHNREEFGISNDDFVVFYCGRISPIKGIKELITAFKLIHNDSMKLIIAGGVQFSQNITNSFFDEIMNEIKQDKRIIYLGYINNEDLPKYQPIADIQVVPTICEEAAGLVCIEGMAAGLPLIVTDSGGMPEYVDEKCAIIIPRDDSISYNIKRAIEVLYENNDMRLSMGQHSKERARKFSKEESYHSFVNIFTKQKNNHT